MGVKGLWKLIESCGVPVPLETLEQKILGVDVSIWLHQAVKGFRGPGGDAVANAHLLTLFHRICKLLFYRIRPVFVFDGGVPHLKKQTLAARRLKRDVATSKAKQVRDRLLSNLLKSQAVRSALGKVGKGPSSVHVPKPKKKEKDMFELPPMPSLEEGTEENTNIKEEEHTEHLDALKEFDHQNLHNFDYESKTFKALPIETQEIILSELRTTRKENSWASINDMPQVGQKFAEFQMARLMKRHQFQVTLDSTQDEIRKKRSFEMEAEMFGELEKHVSLTHRIISEDSAHSILVKKVKDNDVKVENVLVKKEDKGKSLVKKNNGSLDNDFLTQLAKEGIVKPIRNSDSDSDIEDSCYFDGDEDYGFYSQEKTNMEEDGLLQIVGSLMENNGLTQDEILALIKQNSPNESKKQIDDGNKPSTSGSASGFIYNPDADSSDDDTDFVEIKESDDVDVPENNLFVKEIADTSNVNKILENKNDSLWMKIVQQKLDDIVHKTDENSPKKAIVDTRRLEESKEIKKMKSVAISLDFDVKPLKMEDDIFADIFTDINASTTAAALKKSENNSLKPDNRVYSKGTKSIVGDPPKSKNGDVCKNAAINSNGKSDSHSGTVNDSPAKDLQISSAFQEKIEDLVKLELEKMAFPQGNKSSLKVNSYEEDEISVDDVEMMSSSDDSDMVDVEDNSKNPEDHTSSISNSKAKSVDDGPIMTASDSDDDDLVEIDEDNNNGSLDEVQMSQNDEVVSVEGNRSDALQEGNSEDGVEEIEDSKPASHNGESNEANCSTNLNKVVSVSRDSEQEEMGVEDADELERPIEYSKDELKHLEQTLASEQNELLAQAQTVERVAANLNDQMYGESQELLQLFGIPYLVAPMEAEAQCAFLNAMKLTNGTITDDSDIFLFGGSNVYRNFFNQTKHVELFKTENIKANIGLDRDKMICLALLTGSDYTVGLESVGGVLALEVLAEFPGEGIACLKNLKKWWNVAHNTVSASYQSKMKQRMSQIMLPESFPNNSIFEAYHKPEVDESLEKFSWAVPNVDALRMFTMEKFGWNRAKADEILIPVMKKLGIKTSQTRIDSFYTNIKLVKENTISSKRVKEAIAKSKGEMPLTATSCDKSNKRKRFQSKEGTMKKKRKEDNIDAEKKSTNESQPERDDQAPKKPSRTLLIDPSESSSSPSKPKRGRKKKISEGEHQASGPSSILSIPDEEVVKPKKKVTKEDMYVALLKKEKIAQRESDKKAMNEKKRLAAQLLKEKLNKKT